MADFDTLKAQLHENRVARETALTDANAASDRASRLEREADRLARSVHPDGGEGAEQVQKLRAQANAAREEAAKRRDESATLSKTGLGIIADLEVFTDPRAAIGRLHDETPILMMPVRLETRFKTTKDGKPQLWLRIYPDDCWIDSFSPVLTETEVRNAQVYWAAIWAANGEEALERGAWAGLVAAHGAARARWIVQTYKPANAQPAPVAPPAVVLTIATSAPPTNAEKTALAAYWTQVWRADGADDALAAAHETLVNATNAARADELIAAYPVSNPGAPLPTGADRATVSVSVLFVEFAAIDTKPVAWSQAARARMLPDRFVFLGYRTRLDANPVVEVGKPIPAPLLVAPDPSAPEAEQIREDADGNLIVPEPLQWLYDFEKAEKVGMAMRIDLDTAASRGFDRVLVIGLRATADAAQSQADLETLLSAQMHSGLGVSILAQGTPTNNSEAVPAGRGRFDDPDASFDALAAPQFDDATVNADKRDGQWLADMLGVSRDLFRHVEGAGGTDRRAARAMNTALWPATLGYWAETMMAPGFNDAMIARTRRFFERHVVAGGGAPSLRIGWQPYGLLPATAISRIGWLKVGGEHQDPELRYLRRLYELLTKLEIQYRTLAQQVSYVGKAGDPHQLLLDIVGLHPGSVEWTKRYAESLQTYYNRMNLAGFGGWISIFLTNLQRAACRNKLTELGFPPRPDPPILNLIFGGKDLALKGPVVQDGALSEKDPLRDATTDNRNYIEWLADAAGVSLDALYRQDGFVDDKPPAALLYIMLRHALQLGYSDTAIRLFVSANLFNPSQAALAKQDSPFLHIKTNVAKSESRYQLLYAPEQAITGAANKPLHLHIAENIATMFEASGLASQRAALGRLKGKSTARLERAFADHIDLCSYRLDAWVSGLIDFQLAGMRGVQEGADTPPRQGVYVGGYAWLENLRPEGKELTPVRILDPKLAESFKSPLPLMKDNTNQGFIHAPSLNHAVTAAILRNGYISNASPDNPGAFKVNLTSERVRIALGMIEGIRAGQSMSDLLGYHFERGMHDRHNEAEVDHLIFDLRRAFPLRAHHFRSTKPPEGTPIDAIEARNVINGLALVEQMKTPGNATYPFGKTILPAISAAEAKIVNEEAARLLDIHDAVADLAIAEGVHQAVLGNFDRVASTYDAYARGNFPPEPEVIRTPLQGVGLTHRLALHLDPAAPIAAAPGAPSPRAQAEPSLAAWVKTLLPPAADVGCTVAYTKAATLAATVDTVTLADLGLEPFDWLWLVKGDPAQAMRELEDRIALFVAANLGPRPDKALAISYMNRGGRPFSVFEITPQIRALGAIVSRARPLRVTDLALTAEASSKQDTSSVFDDARLQSVHAALVQSSAALDAKAIALKPKLDDLAAKKADRAAKQAAYDTAVKDAQPQAVIDAAAAALAAAEAAIPPSRQAIVAAVDGEIVPTATLLQNAARFGAPAAAWGGVLGKRSDHYKALLERMSKLVVRWNERLQRFDAKIAAANAAIADPASDDQKRFALLVDAESEIVAKPVLPRPATPALFRDDLANVKKPAFVAKRNAIDALKDTHATGFAALIAEVEALLPLDAFDVEAFDLEAQKDAAVTLYEDLKIVVERVAAELIKRRDEAKTQLDAHDAATADARLAALEAAAKAMLGEDFKIVPRFALDAARATEFANAHAASQTAAPFAHLSALAEPIDFPVDHWLAGVARVREMPKHWEQTGAGAFAFGKAEPMLAAMQFPYVANDTWLGLDFAPGAKLDSEKLLYTAHFAAGAAPGATLCGLLIDEWTETIPGPDADTGIAFHHDRPNNEAPQAMLLVTPADFTGAWRWADLVDAINETLDRAKRRAVEPVHLEATAFAPLLPATVVATQVAQLTIAANLALNNKLVLQEIS